MKNILFPFIALFCVTNAYAFDLAPYFFKSNSDYNNQNNLLIKFQTQAEMNEDAYNDFNARKKELALLIKNMKKYDYLSKKQIDMFEKSQKLWEMYVETYANFASSNFEGGSMRPLVQYSIMQQMYENKINELKEDLKNMEPL